MGTPEKTKMVQGRQIVYKDVVHSNITVKFGCMDRIRILFGRKVYVESTVYTAHDECLVVGSESKAWAEPIFIKKEGGMSEIAPPPVPETA